MNEIATIFFLPLSERPSSYPSLSSFKGDYWHTGIIFNGKVYECFNHGKYKVSEFDNTNPLFRGAVFQQAVVDTDKVYTELTSGTDCAEYVARCVGLSKLTGDDKGEYYPEDVLQYLKKINIKSDKKNESYVPHTFSTNKYGNRITLDVFKLWELVENNPVQNIAISTLTNYDKEERTGYSQEKYDSADTSYPIIIDSDGMVLDGRHRILKALDLGRTTVPTIIATREQIKMAEIIGESFETVRHINGQHSIENTDDFNKEDILSYFYHTHSGGIVHHCGGKHPGMNYTITVCPCGRHSIDKNYAVGHGENREEIEFAFYEKCPYGGWHIESGIKIGESENKIEESENQILETIDYSALYSIIMPPITRKENIEIIEDDNKVKILAYEYPINIEFHFVLNNFSYIELLYLYNNSNKKIGRKILDKFVDASRKIFNCNRTELFALDIGRYAWPLFGFNAKDKNIFYDFKKFVSYIITGEKNSDIFYSYTHLIEMAVVNIIETAKYLQNIVPIIENENNRIGSSLRRAIENNNSAFWKDNKFLIGKWCILGGELYNENIENESIYPKLVAGWDGVLDYNDTKSMTIFNDYCLNENNKYFIEDDVDIDTALFVAVRKINAKATEPIKIVDKMQNNEGHCFDKKYLGNSILLESRQFLFHGTSDKFLKTILSQGLIRNPKKRTWATGALESYPGVYVTSNYSVANGGSIDAVSKFGGSPILVVCQIETRTALWDEDIFPGFIFLINKNPERFKKKYKENLPALIGEYTTFLLNSLTKENQMGLQIHPNLYAVLEKKIHSFVETFFSYINLDRLFAKDIKELHDIYGKKDVREKLDDILRSLKEQNDLIYSFRVPEVGFSGANKIVGIISLEPPLKILWGTVPDDIFNEFKKIIESKNLKTNVLFTSKKVEIMDSLCEGRIKDWFEKVLPFPIKYLVNEIASIFYKWSRPLKDGKTEVLYGEEMEQKNINTSISLTSAKNMYLTVKDFFKPYFDAHREHGAVFIVGDDNKPIFCVHVDGAGNYVPFGALLYELKTVFLNKIFEFTQGMTQEISKEDLEKNIFFKFVSIHSHPPREYFRTDLSFSYVPSEPDIEGIEDTQRSASKVGQLIGEYLLSQFYCTKYGDINGVMKDFEYYDVQKDIVKIEPGVFISNNGRMKDMNGKIIENMISNESTSNENILLEDVEEQIQNFREKLQTTVGKININVLQDEAQFYKAIEATRQLLDKTKDSSIFLNKDIEEISPENVQQDIITWFYTTFVSFIEDIFKNTKGIILGNSIQVGKKEFPQFISCVFAILTIKELIENSMVGRLSWKILDTIFSVSEQTIAKYFPHAVEEARGARINQYAVEEARGARINQHDITDFLRNIPSGSVLAQEDLIPLVQKAQKGDRIAQEDLVKKNMRLVINIAKKYVQYGVPLPDLVQEGNIGLLKAIEKFDVTKGFQFSTYATWWIRKMILKAIYYEQEMRRPEAGTVNFDSLENLLAPDEDLPFNDVDELLDKVLDAKSAKIIRMRYGLGGAIPMTLEAIGKALNTSRETIRRNLEASLKKLQAIVPNESLAQIKVDCLLLQENIQGTLDGKDGKDGKDLDEGLFSGLSALYNKIRELLGFSPKKYDEKELEQRTYSEGEKDIPINVISEPKEEIEINLKVQEIYNIVMPPILRKRNIEVHIEPSKMQVYAREAFTILDFYFKVRDYVYIDKLYLTSITNQNIGRGVVKKIIEVSKDPFKCNRAELLAFDIGRYAWARFGFTTVEVRNFNEYRKFVAYIITGDEYSPILNAYDHMAEVVVANITDVDKYMEVIFPIIEKNDFRIAEDLKEAIINKNSSFWKGNSFLVGKWCVLGGYLWVHQISHEDIYPSVTSGWDGILSYRSLKSMAIFNAYTKLNENENKFDFGEDEEDIDASLFKVMQQINSKAVEPIKIKDIVESKKR